MRQIRPLITIIAALVATLSLTACGDLLSLHPLYLKAQPVFHPELEGRWEAESERNDGALSIQRSEDFYEMEMRSKSDRSKAPYSRWEVHLTDVGGVLFADLLPIDHIGHMFVRVRIERDHLMVAFLDSEWLRERVPHEVAEMDRGGMQAILVQKTPVLRKIVARYAKEPRAYDKDEESYRRVPQPPL